MPRDGDRFQLALVGIAVVGAEQQLTGFEFDANVSLSAADITAVGSY